MQEVFHWLQLRAKLSSDEFLRARRSAWTWVLTLFVLFVVVPVLAFIWFQDSPHPAIAKDYFLFGAGVPMILKSGLGASLASDALVKLGPQEGGGLRRYLGLI